MSKKISKRLEELAEKVDRLTEKCCEVLGLFESPRLDCTVRAMGEPAFAEVDWEEVARSKHLQDWQSFNGPREFPIEWTDDGEQIAKGAGWPDGWIGLACPHGTDPIDCEFCAAEADFTYDAAREGTV